MNAYSRARELSDEESLGNALQSLTQEDVERIKVGEDKAIKFQSRINWAQSTLTQEMFLELSKQSNLLLDEAVGLALTNHQQPNEKTIITKLIQADTLRKVIKQYAAIS